MDGSVHSGSHQPGDAFRRVSPPETDVVFRRDTYLGFVISAPPRWNAPRPGSPAQRRGAEHASRRPRRLCRPGDGRNPTRAGQPGSTRSTGRSRSTPCDGWPRHGSNDPRPRAATTAEEIRASSRHVIDHKGCKRWTERTPEEGLRRREFPQRAPRGRAHNALDRPQTDCPHPPQAARVRSTWSPSSSAWASAVMMPSCGFARRALVIGSR